MVHIHTENEKDRFFHQSSTDLTNPPCLTPVEEEQSQGTLLLNTDSMEKDNILSNKINSQD